MNEDSFPAGLYEHLVTIGLQRRLEALGDERLSTIVPLDADEAHSAVAQYLERLIAGSLAQFRGEEAAERQQRLVERIVEALTAELDGDQSRPSIATPLRRLLAVHSD